MLLQILINAVLFVLSLVFSIMPTISTLPTIAGYDIDGTLSSTMGVLHRFMEVAWPLQIMMQGFLFLMGYYALKLIIKVFFGSRTPTLS